MNGLYDPNDNLFSFGFDALDESMNGRSEFYSGLSDNGESYFRVARLGHIVLSLLFALAATFVATRNLEQINKVAGRGGGNGVCKCVVFWHQMVVAGCVSGILLVVMVALPLIVVKTFVVVIVMACVVCGSCRSPVLFRRMSWCAILGCFSYFLLDKCLFTEMHPSFPDRNIFEMAYEVVNAGPVASVFRGLRISYLVGEPSRHEFCERCHFVTALCFGMIGAIISSNVSFKREPFCVRVRKEI